jgi:hypothetical protein
MTDTQRNGWGGKLHLLVASMTLGLSANVQAVGIEDVVNGGNNFAWEKVEIPGTKCSDGSQFKFWVHDNPGSNNIVLMYEGGGACWDYESCSGALGILGAANMNGLSDAYITENKARYVAPVMNGNDPGLPGRSRTNLVTDGWDAVYIPYCTGDVHVGNNVVTYTDPLGQNPPLNFYHYGYSNSVATLDYLAGRFPSINKMLVTGFSAGGVASAAVYNEARTRLSPNSGYMLNDSGPLFPAPNASYNSRLLHETIIDAWNMQSVFDQLPATFNPDDVGSINDMLATQFPQDKFAYTGFSTDYNFSRFSYERFYPGITEEGILQKWKEDEDIMLDQISQHPNWSYHVAWHRPINDSHCSTIITFLGSHSCPSIRKKRWYEVFEWPWSQSWKCPGTMRGMTSFLSGWIGQGQRYTNVEPSNNYNLEDPGMQLYGPIINDAI